MGKYDAALDLDTRNSLSIILKHVAKGKRILEFGCASGRLTRYLQEELGAVVDIVELDEDSGRVAARWADMACLGPEQGNIESGTWKTILQGKQYDYIIFADVLEHLRFPHVTLVDCRPFLASGGEILVSVPNIAHNAIIIGLMNDIFRYTPLGLLDNTHIHFFTRKSFREMAESLGYSVTAEEANSTPVGRIEVQTRYDMINRAAARALHCRPDGDVYQWIFCLQKQEDAVGKECFYDVPQEAAYVCECFVQTADAVGFSENSKLQLEIKDISASSFHFHADFDLSLFATAGIKKLRLDPLNVNCLLRINELVITDAEGVRHEIRNWQTNGISLAELWGFGTDDPQIEWNVPANLSCCRLECDYDAICFDDESVDKYVESMQAVMAQYKLHNLFSRLNRKIRNVLNEIK